MAADGFRPREWMAVAGFFISLLAMATGVGTCREARETNRISAKSQEDSKAVAKTAAAAAERSALEAKESNERALKLAAELAAAVSRAADSSANSAASAKESNRIASDALRTARGSLSVAGKQLETLDRPWLSTVTEPDGPFRFNDDGSANVWIRLITTNVGRSPAVDLDLRAKLVLLDMPPRDGIPRSSRKNNWFLEVAKAQDSTCKQSRKRAFDYSAGGTVFPGKTDTQSVGFTLSREEVASHALRSQDVEGTFLMPVVVGCAIYSFNNAQEPHLSRFAIRVDRVRKESGEQLRMIKAGETVDVADIRFSPFFFGLGHKVD